MNRIARLIQARLYRTTILDEPKSSVKAGGPQHGALHCRLHRLVNFFA
jgi:hypothetical protein